MASALKVIISNGVEMPLIGFGTFCIQGKSLIFQVIDAALKCGYRSIDTAAVYRNEEDIGLALKELLPKYKLQRKDIFLTSKLSPSDHGKGKVRKAVQQSLNLLSTAYLDLYLVHWPGVGGVSTTNPLNASARVETWKELQQLQKEGLLRSIGVSNYTERHLQELLSVCTIPPAVNQVELHPHYPQKSLLKFCREKNIFVQAYSSLGGHYVEALLADQTLKEVARKVGKTVPQVLLRWALQQNIGIIPRSTKATNIAANIDLDFELKPGDMDAISCLKTSKKYAWDPTNVA